MNGTIQSLPEGKSFGFIRPEGETNDIFFHENELKGVTLSELKKDDAVTFEIVEKASEKDGTMRKSATNVTRV